MRVDNRVCGCGLSEFRFMHNDVQQTRKKDDLFGHHHKKQKVFNYPFYTLENEMYESFIIMFLNLLEVRMFEPGQLIADELDECQEMLFIEAGIYSVGYWINNKPKLRFRFGVPTVIGGFQLSYNRRFDFLYKAYVEMRCLAIRRSSYNKLLAKHPKFMFDMKMKVQQHYSINVFQPLIKRKHLDICYYSHRNDYDQVLFLQ